MKTTRILALGALLAPAQALATHPVCVVDDVLGAGGTYTVDTCGGTNDNTPTCSSGSTAPDVALDWFVPSGGRWIVSLGASTYDTVLEVLDEADCSLAGACDDDSGPGLTSELALDLTGGEDLVIVIDGFGSACGVADLLVTDCDTDDDFLCDDDDICPDNPANPDADADGLCDDDDPCVAGPGNDSDGDGLCDSEDPCPNDNPNDSDGDLVCDSVDVCSDFEDAADFDIGSALGDVASGSTCGAPDDYEASCESFDAGTPAGDASVLWSPPGPGAYRISTGESTFDTVLSVVDAFGCAPDENACDDDLGGSASGYTSSIDSVTTPGTPIRIVVDGFGSSCGDYVLKIEDCDADDDGACDTPSCAGDPLSGDTDGDERCDDIDLCPFDAQNDADFDGVCGDVDLCTGDDATGDSDGDGLCDEFDFTLALNPDPPQANRNLRFNLQNVPAGAKVYVVVSTSGPGSTCVPGTTVCLGIQADAILPGPVATGSDATLINVTVPRSVRGRTVAFQAVWLLAGSGDVSEIEVRTIQ